MAEERGPGRALDWSVDQLRALFEQASDGIFVADLDGRYTEVNAAGCRMLGYTRDEIVGKTIVDLIPPEDVPRLAESRELMLGGPSEVAEWRLRRKDGTYLPVEVSAKILPSGRWQGIVRDITDRKRMEAALLRTQADLNRAQAVARVGSWRLDVQRNELTWTDETYRMFGIPPGTTMTYEAFMAGVHPDDRAELDARWQGALRGESYDVEHRIVVAGRVRWVHERAELEFDGEGKLLGGIGTVQDVTERRQAEDRLAASEARARAIVEQSHNAIVTIDEEQRVVSFNRAAEETFGWTAAEIVGQPVDVLMPQRFRAHHRELVHEFGDSGVPRQAMEHHGRIRGLRKSGEEFPAQGGLSQVDVDNGKLMTVIVRDVTEEMRTLAEEQFLAEVGAILAESLDPDLTLERVGRLAVRTLADLCIVDLAHEGRIERCGVFVRDPTTQWLADAFRRLDLDRRKPHLLRQVLAQRAPMLVRGVTPAFVESLAQDEVHLRLLRNLAPRSLLGVPLLVRGRLLGALMLVSTGRAYDRRDQRLAVELASRAAMALDNAELMRASERANAELRETVERLEAAQRTIRSLTDLLPVCAWCRRIRDDEVGGEWMPLERYVIGHSEAQVTHSICPDCAQKYLGEERTPPT